MLLSGQGGNDIIKGQSGEDFVFGGLGLDVIDGGDDIDTCKIIDEQSYGHSFLECHLFSSKLNVLFVGFPLSSGSKKPPE